MKKRWLGAFFLLWVPISSQGVASDGKEPMHWSGDKQIWDRKSNRVDLFGHAIVDQPGESLTADHIVLDLNSRELDADGNCIYTASDAIIFGEMMHFNLDTRTGTVISGRVANDRFTLSGERINKLGPGRFQTHKGEYSTCRDCAQSWTFEGEDVDLEFEGYAYMSNVIGKIKDIPVLWFPYLIMPLKTQRQSGFLFPRFGANSTDGFTFLLPYFWAIDRSVDMTLALGDYTNRGYRAAIQARYARSSQSVGQIDYYFQRDKSVQAPTRNRWGLTASQYHDLPFGISEKFRFNEMSDNRMPIDFMNDTPGRGEPVLASDLIFSRSAPEISTIISARRFRNLLSSNLTQFDPTTVQLYPSAVMTTNDKFLFESPISVGLALGVTNFTRTAPAFDYDPSSTPGAPFTPGVDPVRKATRASLIPSLYTTLRPWDVVSIVPSLQYQGYFYSFHNELPNLSRGYLLFQTSVSTQLERVYETSNPEIPRIKHLIRPFMTYSRIPYKLEPDHPFIRQVKSRSGYNFDDNDIVPLDTSVSYTNYFVPLGDSISYGLTTQLIRRRGAQGSLSSYYQRLFELQLGQTYNFREFLVSSDNPRPVSRLYSGIFLYFDKFATETTFYYYPYINKPQITTSMMYILERSIHERILNFDRSVSIAYSGNSLARSSSLQGMLAYSLSDYLLPTFSASFDLTTKTFLNRAATLKFQSPSRCYTFSITVANSIERPDPNFTFDFALNLTGSGFGGISEVTTRAISQ